jgi:RecA/RadA recombinase
MRHLLSDLIPGTLLTGSGRSKQPPRPTVEEVGRLHVRPAELPLRTDTAEATTRVVLSAMAIRLKADERMAFQIVLGPRHAPRVVPPNSPDPTSSLAQVLVRGDRPASADTRSRVRERLSQAGFAATMRLGASSPDPERRKRFLMGLLSAISTAQSPGLRINLTREDPKRLNNAQLPWRWPLHLSVAELVGLLGWPLGGPLGDADLPGLPPAHPKALRAAASVHTGPRVFARSAAPGDDRLLGVSSADQMLHMINYGPSGSGKTNVALHLIMADVEAGRPVAVLDPKKQLVDDVLARIPDHRLNDVVILDAGGDLPTGFNPLDATGRDPDVVVDGILAVFEAVFHDGWGPRTADLFSAGLRTLARASTAKRPATLLDLPKLWTDPRFRRRQVGRIQADMALAGFWAAFEAQTPAAQAAMTAAPMNKLRQFLLRPAISRMLDQQNGKFRLRDTFRDRRIVLVPLNEGLIGQGTAALLGSLVVADLWQATQERASEPDASKHPGVVYVDEAPRFLNLPLSLADALAVSRSLSVGWWLGAQFRDQFPATLRQAVDHNARNKVIFAAEYEDARDTAKRTRALTPEDFMALPRYHAYVNLVADGHPSGWALVKTLPPPPATTDPNAVRAVARANYAPDPQITPSADTSESDEATAKPQTDKAALVVDPAQIGRKRRQR